MKKYTLTINNNSYAVIIQEVNDDYVTAEVNGVKHKVDINSIENIGLIAQAEEQVAQAALPPKQSSGYITPVSTPPPQSAGAGDVTTPIPGQIMSIHINKGDNVSQGQKLIVLEAMKLENTISATHDGIVKDILVKEGEVVNQGQTLVVIE